MGTGWRIAFNRRGNEEKPSTNPSTPRLLCKTGVLKNTPKCDKKSPRSPLSILKNTLRVSRNNCGVCSETVKTGPIYTAECSHTFHFPCIASHVRNQGSLICPLCSTAWKNVPLLAVYTQKQQVCSPRSTNPTSYADDEQLITPKAVAKFVNPIDDEHEEDVDEFRGFFVNSVSSTSTSSECDAFSVRAVELSLQPDAAVISQGLTHYTYALVLKVKAPPPPPVPDAARRAPIDLVTVLDVSASMAGAKLEMLKRAMRLVIASLGSADRLSILAFSAAPTRLLPFRRMTPHGQRSARKIVDRLTCTHGSSMSEALREATRVLEQRRERNPVATIILLSDGQDDVVPVAESHVPPAHSTRYAHVEIPVHSTGFSRNPDDNAFSKCVAGLLSVVVQDLRIQIGFSPGSDPGEITAIYSCNERPKYLGSGCIILGDLYAEEEKEVLVEIQVPVSRVGSHYVISAKCSHKDPATQDLVYGKEHTLLAPRPQTGLAKVDRLRNVFISSRAIAESRRLIEHNELSSAMQLLSSSRALLLQSRTESGDCIRSLEAELSEVQWRRNQQLRRNTEEREIGLFVDENGTAAQKLAKVAHMTKSFSRVSDLHGFENARF